MKKIDLNTTEGLKVFQEKLNKKINEHIEKVNLNEKITQIENLSFGKLKALFESISPNLFSTDKGKDIIKKYIKTIKEDENLKQMYVFSELIKEGTTLENVELFLTCAVGLTSVDKDCLYEATKKLAKVVADGVKNSNAKIEGLDTVISNKDELSESIEYLATHKQTAKNLNEWLEKTTVITKYLKENKKENKVISDNDYSQKEILKFLKENAEQNDMTEWEKETIADVTLLSLSKGNKSDLFEEYKNKCITALNNTMNENIDIETKSRLSLMVEQIKSKKYNEETFIDDLLKLSELSTII